jgi:tetratricopeptide (TPR) repeat protein
MSLAAQSLVYQAGTARGEPRLGMLETIREYGLELLEASGEADAVRRAHAEYFLAQLSEIEAHLHGRDQHAWFQRLTADLDNLRAVLSRSLSGEVDVEIGLHVAGRLNWFWSLRGFPREGQGWLRALLAMPAASAQTPARAWALQSASALAVGQAELAEAEAFARESATIFRAAGDLQHGARSLAQHGAALAMLGQHDEARSVLEESVATAREVGDRWGLAYALHTLGAATRNQGDLAKARALYEESSALAREIGDLQTLGLTLAGLAAVARAEGDRTGSAAFWQQALAVSHDFGDNWLLPRAVAGLAGAAVLAGQHKRAARLFGIADALREANGTREVPLWQVVVDQDTAVAQSALGELVFSKDRSRGRAMPQAEAIAYALEAPD